MEQQSNTSLNLPQTSYQNVDYYQSQQNNNTLNNIYNYPATKQSNCDVSYPNQTNHQINQRNKYNINQPNIYFDQQPFDTTSWSTNDTKLVNDIERSFKFSDQIETIEISSKDLSPASCCSNIEQFLQGDCLKKDPSNYFNNNFNYNTQQQKFMNYPSCSQGRSDNNIPKYCSIQRQTIELNSNYCENQTVNLNYAEQDQPNYYLEQQNYNSLSVQISKPLESNLSNICPRSSSGSTDFFLNLSFDAINNLDKTITDESNSSDIVVEDSDDDGYSETPLSEVSSKCLVCNIGYSINGSQFYILTKNVPLTMSTQKSVLNKLKELLGDFSSRYLNSDCLYLCSPCLGLINTIDHLQMKLNSCKIELHTKFAKTVFEKKSEVCQRKKRIVNKTRGLFCKPCNKFIRFKTLFENHSKLHKLNRYFLCEFCGSRFIRYRNLYQHKLKHRQIIENKITFSAFLCKICSKPFRTKSNLKEHENYCSGKLPFKCKLCYKRFTTSTKLKSHVKLKHDKKFTSICSICNIGFINPSDYKSHMVTHSTDKKYKCTQCDKSYKTLGNLNFHFKFHSKILPYNCSICTKGFMRKEYLEAHVNIHNNIKNFACTLCDKKFVSQKNLDAHFKYHDTTTQKKVCNICFKTVNTKFEEHLRTHTNLKEFECDLCDWRFNTKSAMAKHKKRKHMDEQKRC